MRSMREAIDIEVPIVEITALFIVRHLRHRNAVETSVPLWVWHKVHLVVL